MKQLIQKELREQFQVAVIGLVIFSVWLFLILANYDQMMRRVQAGADFHEVGFVQPLLSQYVLIQAASFCGIFGILLGWLQIHAEKHPDLWAFLVHHPVSRTVIFQSKILPGLLLYTAAAGLPLLGFLIAVSTPGRIAAPFEWAMTLPLVAIFLVGIVSYFAGMLTGLRKARWYASRGCGLGLAIVANLAIFDVPEFWQALLIIVGASGILAVAVWGSFQTGGCYRQQPILGKLAVTFAATAWVMVLLLVLLGLVTSVVSINNYSYSHYQLTKDGKVWKWTRSTRGPPALVDLDGNPLPNESTGRKVKEADWNGFLAPSVFASANTSRRKSYQSILRFCEPWHTLDKTFWYLTRAGRLVAYDGITRKPSGSLAPSETTASGPRDNSGFLHGHGYHESFFAYQQPVVLATATTAYLVDLEKRELKPLFAATNGESISGYQQSGNQNGGFRRAGKSVVLILTRTSIRVIDWEGQTILQLPFEPSPPKYPSVSVASLDPTNTYAVRFDPDHLLHRESGGNIPTHIKWFNADGLISHAMDLPKLPEMEFDNVGQRFLYALAPPAFPFYTWEKSYRAAHALRLMSAILCAAIGWWLARRYNFAQRAKLGWAFFHFAFGIPGLLAFLAVQEWPAREACPNCKKLRVVNREQCEHCTAPFAPPEKTGTEIFVPLEPAGDSR